MLNRREIPYATKLFGFFTLLVFVVLCLTVLVSIAGSSILQAFPFFDAQAITDNPLLLFALIIICTGTVFAALVGRRPLRFMALIFDSIDRIAAGDYSVRLDLGRNPMLRDVADHFNHMAKELGNVQMLRDDFVSNFSHEFKTPIVSIRGYARILRRDDLSPAERDEYLDIIISESERLATLSRCILDLAKVEHQVILTNCTSYNLSEQLRRCTAIVENNWKDKELEYAFEGDEVICMGNEELLGQALTNLLGNAAKFSDPGGHILAETRSQGDQVVIRITNGGATIEPSQWERVFEKFYQADPSHASQGAGLGLPLVRQIARLHGGSVRVACSSPEGTTFELLLPLSG